MSFTEIKDAAGKPCFVCRRCRKFVESTVIALSGHVCQQSAGGALLVHGTDITSCGDVVEVLGCDRCTLVGPPDSMVRHVCPDDTEYQELREELADGLMRVRAAGRREGLMAAYRLLGDRSGDSPVRAELLKLAFEEDGSA